VRAGRDRGLPSAPRFNSGRSVGVQGDDARLQRRHHQLDVSR
jgi:hypothetical protein